VTLHHGYGPSPTAEDEATRRIVHLRGVPIRDFVHLQVYFDDMVREMQLIAVGRSDRGAAGRLADLAVYVQHDIAGHRNILYAEALQAEAAGLDRLDMGVNLLPSSVPDARRLIEVAEELDAQSRNGLLLTAPASDAVLDVLRWIVEEIEGQLMDGRPPRTCPT